jgi:hypothetical protein
MIDPGPWILVSVRPTVDYYTLLGRSFRIYFLRQPRLYKSSQSPDNLLLLSWLEDNLPQMKLSETSGTS